MSQVYKSLDEVAEIKSGTFVDSPSSLRWLCAENPTNFSVHDSRRISLLTAKEGNPEFLVGNGSTDCQRIFLPSGTVVFPHSSDEFVGTMKSIYHRKSVSEIQSVALVPKRGIESSYLFYWLLQFDLRKVSNMKPPVPVIVETELKKVPIPVPNSVQQHHTVEILDRIASLFNQLDELNSNLSSLVVAKFIETFGNPITNRSKQNCIRLDSILKSFSLYSSPNSRISQNRAWLEKSRRQETSGMKHHFLGTNEESTSYYFKENDLIVRIDYENVMTSNFILNDKCAMNLGQHDLLLRMTKSFGYGYIHAMFHFDWFRDLLNARSRQMRYRSDVMNNILELQVPFTHSIKIHQEFDTWIKKIESIRELRRQSTNAVDLLFKSMLLRKFSFKNNEIDHVTD